MNVKAMQRADRWAGIPMCSALTAARRLFGDRVPNGSYRPGLLLFVKLAEQDATVLAYPAIGAGVPPATAWGFPPATGRALTHQPRPEPWAHFPSLPALARRPPTNLTT
jgi:uncharacterized membrane protein